MIGPQFRGAHRSTGTASGPESVRANSRAPPGHVTVLDRRLREVSAGLGGGLAGPESGIGEGEGAHAAEVGEPGLVPLLCDRVVPELGDASGAAGGEEQAPRAGGIGVGDQGSPAGLGRDPVEGAAVDLGHVEDGHGALLVEQEEAVEGLAVGWEVEAHLVDGHRRRVDVVDHGVLQHHRQRRKRGFVEHDHACRVAVQQQTAVVVAATMSTTVSAPSRSTVGAVADTGADGTETSTTASSKRTRRRRPGDQGSMRTWPSSPGNTSRVSTVGAPRSDRSTKVRTSPAITRRSPPSARRS